MYIYFSDVEVQTFQDASLEHSPNLTHEAMTYMYHVF